MNLTTLENRHYCVAVTSCGLCLIGHAHDAVEGLSLITRDHMSSSDNVTSSSADVTSSSGNVVSPKGQVKFSQQVSFVSEGDEERYYETIYSLLDDISPMYRGAFCNELSSKLLLLKQHQEAEEDS